MFKKLFGVFLFFISLNSYAGDAILTWDPPLEYEDASPILAGEIVNYKIYYGTTSGGPYSFSVTVAGNVTSVTVTGLAKGTWYFVATATTTNGLESSYSTQVSKSVSGTSKPKPPRNLR